MSLLTGRLLRIWEEGERAPFYSKPRVQERETVAVSVPLRFSPPAADSRSGIAPLALRSLSMSGLDATDASALRGRQEPHWRSVLAFLRWFPRSPRSPAPEGSCVALRLRSPLPCPLQPSPDPQSHPSILRRPDSPVQSAELPCFNSTVIASSRAPSYLASAASTRSPAAAYGLAPYAA